MFFAEPAPTTPVFAVTPFGEIVRSRLAAVPAPEMGWGGGPAPTQ